jgi:hypothetical protein
MSGRTDADATVLVEKEESARAPTSSAHEGDVIEADVQSLLEEMAASFKSFSETVFAKSALLRTIVARLPRVLLSRALTDPPARLSIVSVYRS